MNCCTSTQCKALEDVFDSDYAADDLKSYLKKGPSKPTRTLLNGLRALGDVRGRSLLDIGGGIGAIQLELLKAGLAQATGVDASAAYLKTAQAEADRLGYGARTTYLHGNFVEHAAELAPVDIVTLDRVICCYPDMPALVTAAIERANYAFAWVAPRDTWWMRVAKNALNLWERVQRSTYRFFVHADADVEALLAQRGWQPHLRRTHGMWQVNIWRRAADA
jgi:SAM-dependent methyltransferase